MPLPAHAPVSARRRRTRWLSAALVPATAAVLAAPPAALAGPQLGYGRPAPPSACVIEQLPEPDSSSMSIVTGADRTGRYIVGRGYPADGSFGRSPVMWFNGDPTPVDLPGVDQQLTDVNAFGVAVGQSFDASTFRPTTPWIYRDGVVTALPGVDAGNATAVNARGDVVGNRAVGDFRRPVRWPAGGSGPVDLPLPADATSGEARDVDVDGTVVGFYSDAEFTDHAYVWRPDGSAGELPLPEGLGPISRAFTIRNGWVTGLSSALGRVMPLRWNLATGEVQQFPQFDLRASAANWSGWLVGSDLSGKALLVSPGGDLTLPGLTEHGIPLGDIATTISDSGRTIAGQALDAGGDLRAVRWSCD